MPRLLVIDDEPSILHAFSRAFREPETTVITASTSHEGLGLVNAQPPDVVVLDLNLPDDSGLVTFKKIHEFDARIPVLFITGQGTTDSAIEAMKLGAFDYLLKPLELSTLREQLNRAFEISRLAHIPAVLQDEKPVKPASDVLVGRCPAMQEVYKAIGRVASQDVTVLLLGETGTGKELVARAIYQHSRRATAPFLTLNCAALPETLLDSELFGHERGAFTGADTRRIGKFEQFSGGTIFLDEIGDASPLVQSKLLRVLEEQRFERVGGNETVTTDVRLIAATNYDLKDLVDTDQFRRDLYYRLSVFTIALPPLRERGDDLVLLIDHFIQRFSPELGKKVQRASDETLKLCRDYSWPGNVRELQNVIKQSLLRASGNVLIPDFLPDWLRDPAHATAMPGSEPGDWEAFTRRRLEAGSQSLYADALTHMERQLLTAVLRYTKGNQVHAARILGINRGSLRTKIRTLGISIDRTISDGG
jgi:two-component system nitrogen regulation response regulator GlnG